MSFRFPASTRALLECCSAHDLFVAFVGCPSVSAARQDSHHAKDLGARRSPPHPFFFASAFLRHVCTSGSYSQTTTTSGRELGETPDMLSLITRDRLETFINFSLEGKSCSPLSKCPEIILSKKKYLELDWVNLHPQFKQTSLYCKVLPGRNISRRLIGPFLWC